MSLLKSNPDYRIVTGTAAIDRMQWDRFVYDHFEGNIFQTPQMYEVYTATEKYFPIVLACYKENSLMGILLSVLQKEYKGWMGKLSTRAIIWGGPLVRNNDINVLEAIMKEYDRIVKNNAIYTQIRNICSMGWAKDKLKKMGYLYEDHLNIVIDLNKSEDQLWKDVHSKRKNEIRRAEKEGTKMVVCKDVDSFEKCFQILHEVYQRARLPLPDSSLFKRLFNGKEGSSYLKIFTAQNNGETIGALFALCWRDRVFDWYAGAYRQYLSKYPNDLLPWGTILWAKRNGYKIFDFGGAGKTGVPYGVRDFKLKFGGELVDLGRFQKIHRPIMMKIASYGFKVWRFVKGIK